MSKLRQHFNADLDVFVRHFGHVRVSTCTVVYMDKSRLEHGIYYSYPIGIRGLTNHRESFGKFLFFLPEKFHPNLAVFVVGTTRAISTAILAADIHF